MNRSNVLTDLPHFDRAVLIVIDALRYDFVEQMPKVSHLLRNQQACQIKVKVHPPTVTMPRLKALISGTVPSFLDVILNFGSTEMTTDNILFRLKAKNRNIVFYGDNVWTKMFPEPKMFLRTGVNTDSFFVNDFYEGDKNITKNLGTEVKKADEWNLLLLHYLGLDHIGHVLGAKDTKINEKLLEMDRVIIKLQENFKGKNVPIFITGDHGMRDAGGHGGSSSAEIFVPFLAIGFPCRGTETNKIYDQVDLATTLSVLLGLPIPSTSVGGIITELFHHLNDQELVLALNYSGNWLLQKSIKQKGENFVRNTEYFSQLIEAMKRFGDGHTDVTVRGKFTTVIEKMREGLVENFVKYDMTSIKIGIFTAISVR